MKMAQTIIEEVLCWLPQISPQKGRGIYWALVLASVAYMRVLWDLHQLHQGPVLYSTYREAYLHESPVGFTSATSRASPVSDKWRGNGGPNIGTDLQDSIPRTITKLSSKGPLLWSEWLIPRHAKRKES